jgi:hypothetical protein
MSLETGIICICIFKNELLLLAVSSHLKRLVSWCSCDDLNLSARTLAFLTELFFVVFSVPSDSASTVPPLRLSAYFEIFSNSPLVNLITV